MSKTITVVFVGGARDGEISHSPIGHASRNKPTYWHSRAGHIEHREHYQVPQPNSYYLINCCESSARVYVMLGLDQPAAQ